VADMKSKDALKLEKSQDDVLSRKIVYRGNG